MLVVDTSSWISYFRGASTDLFDSALQNGSVLLPPLVAAELLSASNVGAKQRDALRQFVLSVQLCATPVEHWIAVGELRAALARRGITVSTPDAHVAQCARDYRAELMSDDAVFTRIAGYAGLRVVATG